MADAGIQPFASSAGGVATYSSIQRRQKQAVPEFEAGLPRYVGPEGRPGSEEKPDQHDHGDQDNVQTSFSSQYPVCPSDWFDRPETRWFQFERDRARFRVCEQALATRRVCSMQRELRIPLDLGGNNADKCAAENECPKIGELLFLQPVEVDRCQMVPGDHEYRDYCQQDQDDHQIPYSNRESFPALLLAQIRLGFPCRSLWRAPVGKFLAKTV